MQRKVSLKGLFEFTDSISESYEVLRTVGLTIETKGGPKHCRVEAIKRNGDRLFAALVWTIDDQGKWERWHGDRHGTLQRVSADFALRSMIEYIHQHMSD